MIEQIESFNSQFEFFAFRNSGDLGQCHVPIVKAGPVEKSSPRVAQDSQLFLAEKRNVEIWLLLMSPTEQHDLDVLPLQLHCHHSVDKIMNRTTMEACIKTC
jgi:hypothetical protein